MSAVASPTSVLLVEDDVRLSELVSRYLETSDMRVTAVARGDRVLEIVRQNPPDVIILDLGLPGEDGFAVCRQLRPVFRMPILILTARDNDIDHVLGLELGADDYVIKPVDPRVLLARIHALLRRTRATSEIGSRTLRFGGLVINLTSHSVLLSGAPIDLSHNEFELLAHLAAHAGEIQSRDALFRSLYNREYDGIDRMLDIRVSRLRKKLGEDAENSERIKTIWGAGYLFVPDAW